MTRNHCTYLFILVLCFLGAVVCANANVAVLTDANFEHDTQATTGSTTGRWLVVFHNKNNYEEVQKMLTDPEISEGNEGSSTTSSLVDVLLEEGVVVGTMDISTNPNTVERLKVPGTPHALMLVQGKLYRTNSWEDIKDFAISEYEILTAEPIPPLPSFIDTILSHPHGQMGLAGVAGIMILSVMAVVARMIDPGPEPAKKMN